MRPIPDQHLVNLDPRTMVVVIILSTLLIGIGLLVVTRGYLGEVTGAYQWALATFIQSFGWFITGFLRGRMPEVISAVFGPFLVQAALMLCLFILHDFEAKPIERRWFYGLLALDLVLSLYFTFVFPSTAARQALIGATTGVVTLGSAYVLLTGPNRRVGSHRFMACVFGVCGLAVVVRGGLFLAIDPVSVSPTATNAMSSVSLLIFYVFAVVLPFGFVLMCNDRYVSQRKTAEEALSAAALVDALTQLPNRAMVTSRLSSLAARAEQPTHGLCAVLFIDVNNFKCVNDSLGHHAGDQVLIETGQRLARVLRAGDVVTRCETSLAGRFGGDEFVIILERLGKPDDAAAVAERILAAMAAPFAVAGQRMSIQCSIGISVPNRTGPRITTEDLLREADIAMYRAKSAGGANFVVFDRSMHVDTRPGLTLESDPRTALECDPVAAN